MDDDDLEYKHAFSCLVSGSSKSGKTSFCIRLLQNLAGLCTDREFVGGIVWCYSEKTAVPKRWLFPQTPHITRAYRRTLVATMVVDRAS